MFADDLMIFCYGKEQSVRRVMEALDYFTRVTGMIENMEKSHMLISGTDEQTKALNNSLLKSHRIKNIYANILSQAGRLQLIIAVLFFM